MIYHSNRMYGNIVTIFLVAMAIIISNLVQMPFVVKNGYGHILSYAVWILLAVWSTILGLAKKYIYFDNQFTLYICLFMLILVVGLVTSKSYYSSSIIYSMCCNMICFYCGCNVSDYVINKLKSICIIYIISAMVVAIYVWVCYIGIGFKIEVKPYVYASKNSLGYIILSAILLLLFYPYKKLIYKKVCFVIALGMIWMLVEMRVRSLLYLMGVGVIIYASKKTKNNVKIKFFYILLLSVFIALLLFCDSVRNSVCITLFNQKIDRDFWHDISMNGWNSESMYILTGTRNKVYGDYIQILRNNWIWGVGEGYFESFPISAFIQFGLFLGSLVLYTAYMPIVNILRSGNDLWCWRAIKIMALFFAVSGFADGLSPVGPGMRVYILYFLYGVLQSSMKFKLSA